MVEESKGSFSGKSFSGKSFTLDSFHYVPNPEEKVIANVSGQKPSIKFSAEIKEVEYTKPATGSPHFNIVLNNFAHTFNSITNFNQDNSIENIMTIVTQQDISVENKTILQSQIRAFEQECKKSDPDSSRLRSILNTVCPIAKDVGLMLIKYGLDNGILKF